MRTNTMPYNSSDSLARLDEILSASDSSYEELGSIPDPEKLTFTNGYYVNCSALFVDIRDSSKLPEKHRRPTLAKIYRAYISEIVAIMNSDARCKHIDIVGDCVKGVFDTSSVDDFDHVFRIAGQIQNLICSLNSKLQEKGILPIRIGAGIDYGRALMIKAGYKGSSINDVVWMGDVLNQASKLCDEAHRPEKNNKRVMISPSFCCRLSEKKQKFLEVAIPDIKNMPYCYHSDMKSLIEGFGEHRAIMPLGILAALWSNSSSSSSVLSQSGLGQSTPNIDPKIMSKLLKNTFG